jgi:hypothetical protein
VDPPGVEFDEEQHVKPSQPHRVDGEEVARHDPGGLLSQERRPRAARPPGCGVEPVTTKRRPDRGGGDAYAKLLELSLDALVAPPGVVPGQADNQVLDLLVQRRPASLAMRVGPCTGDQSPVPAQQRVGLDEEARPAGPREQAADRGEQGPVCRLQPGA